MMQHLCLPIQFWFTAYTYGLIFCADADFLKTPCYLYMLQFIYYKKHYTVSKCLKSLRKMSTNCLSSNVEKHVRFILAQHFPSRNLSLSCRILERCHACHSTENTFCSHQKGGKLLPSGITKIKHRKVDVDAICWNLKWRPYK